MPWPDQTESRTERFFPVLVDRQSWTAPSVSCVYLTLDPPAQSFDYGCVGGTGKVAGFEAKQLRAPLAQKQQACVRRVRVGETPIREVEFSEVWQSSTYLVQVIVVDEERHVHCLVVVATEHEALEARDRWKQ